MLESHRDIAHFVTNLGDAAILLPTSFVVLLFLIAFRDYRLAAAWGVTVGSCAIVMVVLKLMFRTCGAVWTHAAIVSPSGHTALSTTIYGALGALIVMRSTNLWLRVATAAAAGAFAVAIAMSRVAVGAHNVGEVAIGLSVGIVFTALFWTLVLRAARPKTPILLLIVTAIVLITVFYGYHMNIETMFEALAIEIRGNTGLCGSSAVISR